MSSLELAQRSPTPPAHRQAAAEPLFPAQEVLAFRLDDEEYGIALRCVQEIRSYQAPTRIAGAPPRWLGVIDLRGAVVPLLDLRQRLGLPGAAVDALTVVIVVALDERCVGVVADQVNDVIALDSRQIRPMPRLPACPEQRHMPAMAVVEQRRVTLLDIEGLLREEAAPGIPEAEVLAA